MRKDSGMYVDSLIDENISIPSSILHFEETRQFHIKSLKYIYVSKNYQHVKLLYVYFWKLNSHYVNILHNHVQ